MLFHTFCFSSILFLGGGPTRLRIFSSSPSLRCLCECSPSRLLLLPAILPDVSFSPHSGRGTFAFPIQLLLLVASVHFGRSFHSNSLTAALTLTCSSRPTSDKHANPSTSLTRPPSPSRNRDFSFCSPRNSCSTCQLIDRNCGFCRR